MLKNYLESLKHHNASKLELELSISRIDKGKKIVKTQSITTKADELQKDSN